MVRCVFVHLTMTQKSYCANRRYLNSDEEKLNMPDVTIFCSKTLGDLLIAKNVRFNIEKSYNY